MFFFDKFLWSDESSARDLVRTSDQSSRKQGFLEDSRKPRSAHKKKRAGCKRCWASARNSLRTKQAVQLEVCLSKPLSRSFQTNSVSLQTAFAPSALPVLLRPETISDMDKLSLDVPDAAVTTTKYDLPSSFLQEFAAHPVAVFWLAFAIHVFSFLLLPKHVVHVWVGPPQKKTGTVGRAKGGDARGADVVMEDEHALLKEQSRWATYNAPCFPRAKKSGIRGSPGALLSPWAMLWSLPSSPRRSEDASPYWTGHCLGLVQHYEVHQSTSESLIVLVVIFLDTSNCTLRRLERPTGRASTVCIQGENEHQINLVSCWSVWDFCSCSAHLVTPAFSINICAAPARLSTWHFQRVESTVGISAFRACVWRITWQGTWRPWESHSHSRSAPPLVWIYHFDIQSTGQKSHCVRVCGMRVVLWRACGWMCVYEGVCVCVMFVCLCVRRCTIVSVLGSLLQTPRLCPTWTSQWQSLCCRKKKVFAIFRRMLEASGGGRHACKLVPNRIGTAMCDMIAPFTPILVKFKARKCRKMGVTSCHWTNGKPWRARLQNSQTSTISDIIRWQMSPSWFCRSRVPSNCWSFFPGEPLRDVWLRTPSGLPRQNPSPQTPLLMMKIVYDFSLRIWWWFVHWFSKRIWWWWILYWFWWRIWQRFCRLRLLSWFWWWHSH